MLKQRLIAGSFFLGSFLFTALVFMNMYEVVFNKDIALASSVQRVEPQGPINQIVQEFQIKSDTRLLNQSGQMENLDSLQIPSLKLNLTLEESRRIGGLWYRRPSRGHYVGLNKDDYGNTGDYLIYTDKSWRTVPAPDQIQTGMLATIAYQGGYAATFTVAEKTVLPDDRSFIFSKAEGREIILIVEDDAAHTYYGFSLDPK